MDRAVFGIPKNGRTNLWQFNNGEIRTLTITHRNKGKRSAIGGLCRFDHNQNPDGTRKE